jgi:hypothetical protein
MKKQTAVEFLGINLNALFLDISPELWVEIEVIFQQAKEMEKEQIETAYQVGDGDAYNLEQTKTWAKQYYDETYGGDK